jgi:hypothetical protein
MPRTTATGSGAWPTNEELRQDLRGDNARHPTGLERAEMSWCWLARAPNPIDDALASSVDTALAGAPAGAVAAWPAGRKPVPDAVPMDARLIDEQGDPPAISLVILPPDASPPFDDPAVSAALRAVLAGSPPDGVSTFVRDASHFAGAVTVRRDDRGALRDDPFARVCHGVLLNVGAGIFGRVPPVPGPVIQRYSGKPWPAAGF